MRVAELMQKDVKAVRPDVSVADVIASLADAHVSGVPVVDRHGQMLGVISSTDVLTQEAEAEDTDARTTLLESTLARDIMTPHPLTIDPFSEIDQLDPELLLPLRRTRTRLGWIVNLSLWPKGPGWRLERRVLYLGDFDNDNRNMRLRELEILDERTGLSARKLAYLVGLTFYAA